MNLSEEDYKRKKNKWLAKIHAWVTAHGGGPMIPYSGSLEAKLQVNADVSLRPFATVSAVRCVLPQAGWRCCNRH